MFTEHERELIRRALTDQHARRQLRQYILPFVDREALRNINRWDARPEHQSDFLTAGMSEFDRAFNIYLKNLPENGNIAFSIYFIWWARQAMWTHFEEHRDDA